MNQDIKNAIYMNGLRHWQVADALGINEATLSRKLRHEIPDDEKNRLLEIIGHMKGGEQDD